MAMLRLLIPILVMFVGVAANAGEANACGDIGCHAMVVLTEQPTREEPEAVRERTIAPAAGEAEVRARDLAKTEPPTPEFWLKFKSYAYRQLPTHEEKRFTAVWVGMAVTTPDETIAGVGLQGIWW